MSNDVKEQNTSTLSEQETKQGFRLVNVKVPPNMDILFVDDAHIDMLTTAAEITANGANVSIAMREHTHKGIENVVRADRIAHALQTIGRAQHTKAMSEKAAEQLKRLS
jgi:hypothetical protein